MNANDLTHHLIAELQRVAAANCETRCVLDAMSPHITDAVLSATVDQMSAIAAAVLQSFEGGLPDMARAVAAKFELPQRDVLHELHSEFRKIRTAAAKRAEKKLAEMPKIRETVLEAEDEVPT